MPDLGDYITRLMCDASKYTQGTSAAVAGNKELSGSVNSIIGQLQRQQRAIETAGRTTLDWINADTKASEEVKEHTRALLVKVDALKKAAQAEKELAAGTGAMSALTKPDHFGRGLARMKSQADIDAARALQAADRDANDPFTQGMKKYNEKDGDTDPFQRGLRVMNDDRTKQQRDLDARRAAGQSGDAWREEDQAERDRIDAIRRRTLEADNARRAEADSERRAMGEARARSRQMAQDRRDDANVMRQLNEQGYGRRNRPEHQNQEARDNRRWAGVELFRAAEDAMQGGMYGGLKGGILAASNNISQAGAAFGATGAMVGSVVSGVTLLTVSMVEMWMKSKSGAQEAADAAKNYLTTMESIVTANQATLRSRVAIRDIGEAKGSDQLRLDDQRRRDRQDALALEIKDREATARNANQKLNIPAGTSVDEMQEWIKEGGWRKRAIGGEIDPGSGLTGGGRDASKWEQRMMDAFQGTRDNFGFTKTPAISKDALTPENLANMAEAQKQLVALRSEENRIVKELVKSEERRNQLMDAEIDMQMAMIEDGNARRQRHFKGHPLELETPWQQQQMQNDLNQQERTKKMRDTEAGYKWMESRATTLSIAEADRRQVGGGAMLQAQLEYQLQMDSIKKNAKLGNMDPAERAAAEARELATRDRAIREAKYGNLQADGNSGFGGADVKTSQGFNALVKAMRYSEQDKTIAELKKNGDITQEIVTAMKEGITIKNLNPLPVEPF